MSEMVTHRRTRQLKGQLTDLKLRNLTTRDRPYKVADGNGLFVLISPTGLRAWRWKYRFAGREKVLPLGRYPDVSLAEARAARDEARKKVLSAIDPAEERRDSKLALLAAHENSFEAVARAWHKVWTVGTCAPPARRGGRDAALPTAAPNTAPRAAVQQPLRRVHPRAGHSDPEKWALWSKRFAKDAEGLGDFDLGYLRESFGEFEHFARAVELLRSSSFEARSNKRWSSKFVFPFGPDALYEDLRIDAKGAASNDRRFFARTGEILYLMLSRAKRGPELGDKLVERLFNALLPMNKLVRAMQGAPERANEPRPVG